MAGINSKRKKPELDELPAAPVQRLCSEIQLFDLCELDDCRLRQGRFCTDPNLLRRFEEIAEVDAAQQRIDRNCGEADEDEDPRLLYCDAIVDDDYQDDDDGWDE